MSAITKTPKDLTLAFLGLGITLGFYPMTVPAVWTLSHGGMLGFASLLVAGFCSWTAFIRCRSRAILRWFFFLPIASLVTWFAAKDGLTKYYSGWWREF